MKNIMYGTIFIFSLIYCYSCSEKLNVPESYIMSEEDLVNTIKKTEKNLVLFFTDWCPASKDRIEKTYKPLAKKIKQENLSLNLILLASDQNVNTQKIDELRNLGMDCYYIQKPGSNAIANRSAIKKFINNAFPKNEIAQINQFQFGIPVELLITDKLEIVNEKEEIKSYVFTDTLLDK